MSRSGTITYECSRIKPNSLPHLPQPKLRKAASGSEQNAMIRSCCSRIKPAIRCVEQFPSLIQITFGGAPRRKLLWRKSASLLAMTSPSLPANSQIMRSEAELSPKSRTCADRGNNSNRSLRSPQKDFGPRAASCRNRRKSPLTIRREGEACAKIFLGQVRKIG